MNLFPTLYTGPVVQTRVDYSGQNFTHFFVRQGFDPKFTPGNMPPPTWFVAVNPNGYCDAEAEEFDFNQCFDSADAVFFKVTGLPLEAAQRLLLNQAAEDAEEHVEAYNGGLYAIWEVEDALVIGAFDMGGYDLAETTVPEVLEDAEANIVLQAGDCHFHLDTLLEEAATDNMTEQEATMYQMVREVLDYRAAANKNSPSA